VKPASRTCLAALCVLAGFTRAAALDLGMDLTNFSSVVSESNLTYTQENEARPWFSARLGDSTKLYLSGLYEFSDVIAAGQATLSPYRLDVGRAELDGSIASIVGPSSVLRWSVGRIELSDFSGFLLEGLYDGAQAELSLGNTTLNLAGAYTGFLYKNDALVSIDTDDAVVNGSSSTYFAPKHILSELGARWVEVLPGQDLGLEAWGQFDLESGTPTNGFYLQPYIEGTIGRSLRWRGWVQYELSYDTSAHNALAAGLLARTSVPELVGLRLTGSVIWASGASGGIAAFTPIKSGPIDAATDLTFSDVLSAAFDASISPGQGLGIGFTGASLFRPNSYFLGSEGALNASFRFTSDAYATLTLGAFAPGAEAAAAGQSSRLSASLSAGFSL